MVVERVNQASNAEPKLDLFAYAKLPVKQFVKKLSM